MSVQWMKHALIASVLTVLMTLPALAQQRRTAAPAPGGPAKPAAGLPFEFKAATRQAAQKAQEAYKALLKARVTHLKATKALLVALKGDSEKGTQGKPSSPVKAVTSKGFDLGEVKDMLGAVGIYSGGFSNGESAPPSGFSYGKPEGNAKQAGIGRSNKVSFEDGWPDKLDHDFNDVILKLDTQIRNVQNSLIAIPQLKFGIKKAHY